MEFRWGGNKPDDAETTKSGRVTLDTLISAAGGDPLPGIFGLLQAVFNVWTSSPPMPGSSRVQWLLWGGRSTLNSLGAIRSYQRAADATWSSARRDVVEEFVEAMQIELWPEYCFLASTIHAYAEGVLDREDRMLGASKNTCVRCFRLPNGVEFFYIFRNYAPPDASARNVSWAGDGPYLRPTDQEKFLEGVGTLVWEAEGGMDLQLALASTEQSTLTISNIGAPDDYVDVGEEEGSDVADVERLTTRCQALMRKGFTRKILFAGPPGCGKSTLARNLARSLGGGQALRIHPDVVECHSIDMITRFVRLLSPRVILFDDLDRNKSTSNRILHYMEAAGNVSGTRGIVVLGTVNTLSTLDPALFRPGRFDEVKIVNEPSESRRIRIVEHYLRKYSISGLHAPELAAKMDQFSGADIQEVLKVVSAVGPDHLVAEVGRVRLQRGLYAGTKVEKFLLAKKKEWEDD